MAYNQKEFLESKLKIKQKNIKYFLSPTLSNNGFKHGFFTKSSSETNPSVLSNHFNLKYRVCTLSQKHSNRIVFGSEIDKEIKVKADGIISDKNNHILWVYTADCMPILFADKKKRIVGAIHCGRKGLENKIIQNLIKFFDKLGTSKEDLLVAIGPSISVKNYFVDEVTYQEFYKKINPRNSITPLFTAGPTFNSDDYIQIQKQESLKLDIKKFAFEQLLDANIPSTNIDVSRLCTFEENNDFFSWRRSKTFLRQWSFIAPE